MTVRSPLLIAAVLLGAAGCATTTQSRPAAPGTQEVHLAGYRLLVPTDKSPDAKARAFDPQGKEIPVVTRPAEDVKGCAPKPGDSGVGPVCVQDEALRGTPTQMSLKATTGRTCWYYDQYGKIHFYPCG